MPLELSRVCTAISPSPTLAIDSKAKALRAEGRDVVSFCAGEPDFMTPQHIRTAAHEALDMGLTKYTPSAGTMELRKAICHKLLIDNDLSYVPAQIIVSNGAKFSIFAALRAIINPGDEILIPTPCWVSYPEMVKIAGGVPVMVPGDPKKSFVTEAADLAPYVTERTKALILNSPNNPNGCIWNRKQLKEIADLAVSRGFYVVSDEIYEKLIYDGEEHVSIASLGEQIYKQTIVVNGMSKAYAMTGWRIGYAAAPLEIAKAMNALQSQVASGSNSIAQYAAVKALTSKGRGPVQLKMMRDAYDERRMHIVMRINRIPGVRCTMPKGAFYVMMDIHKLLGLYDGDVEITDSMTFAQQLLETVDVAVVPGSAFHSEGYCRLSYATSMEEIDRGLDRIEKYIKRLTGSKGDDEDAFNEDYDF